ncbi:MAG: hypothetical protein LBP86_12250 [Azoarcus sp.]|nr:hypothetical protein [Azoarcus sp.]
MNSVYMKPVHNTNWVHNMPHWTPSDPRDQGWKDHMYDLVYTSFGLPAWGENTGTIYLPIVPRTPGAPSTAAYLYLKDCGEFDTQSYESDHEYLKFAFGMPGSYWGAAANNFVDNILTNRVGIKTNGPTGGGSGSATGNRNGLHAYNDYDWNLWSKSIAAVDGDVISFGWSFKGGDGASGNDAAFWMLKSTVSNSIVATGLLAQGPYGASGVANITVPKSLNGYENYVLTIGQMNVGRYHGNQETHNPHTLIGHIMQKSLVPPPPLDTDLDNLLNWGAFEDGFDTNEWAKLHNIVKSVEAYSEKIDPEEIDPAEALHNIAKSVEAYSEKIDPAEVEMEKIEIVGSDPETSVPLA